MGEYVAASVSTERPRTVLPRTARGRLAFGNHGSTGNPEHGNRSTGARHHLTPETTYLMSWSDRHLSKFLSLILRHRPQEIDLRLEPGGWVSLDELVDRSRAAAGAPVSADRIRKLVKTQTKPRFSISGDGQRIRANYGHSMDVDLGLEPTEPPPILYHGTAERALESILAEGLQPRSRKHVHLSTDRADARAVGSRHGSPRILRVRAARMHEAGHRFYPAADGIWLTGFVPSDALEILNA